MPRSYVGPATGSPRKRKPKPASEPDREGLRSWNWLLGVIGAAVAIAALLIVPGIVNRGGQNPVAAAAEATSHSPGVRMTMAVSVQGPEQVSMTGTGLLNGETNRASIRLSASGGAAGPVSIEEVVDDGDLYISSPQLGGQLSALGVSKPWLLIKAEVFGGLLQGASDGVGAGMSANPAEQLDALKDASDSVSEAGRERIDGVDTTHYMAVIDVGKLTDRLKSQASGSLGDLIQKSMEQVSAQSVDVWIDGQGLIRRETSTVAMGSLGSVDMTIDFADYGIHPDIQVPASSEVYDVTPILQNALDELSGN